MKTTLILLMALLLFSGCKSTGTPTPLVTPERIEAVTALGAYYGGTAAVNKGRRADLERALAGLRSLQEEGTADLPAVVKAIGEAGITFFHSPEGQLALGAVVSFTDLWAGTVQPILDDARVRAVLAGAIRGFELALTVQVRDLPDPVADRLLAEAISTRPLRRAR